jgi:sugar phosphate isomerase/epimerase
MKVFKVVIRTVKYLEIDDTSADDLETWEHCMTEDGSFDTAEIISELENNGHDDLDADSETLECVELDATETKAYLNSQ